MQQSSERERWRILNWEKGGNLEESVVLWDGGGEVCLYLGFGPHHDTNEGRSGVRILVGLGFYSIFFLFL